MTLRVMWAAAADSQRRNALRVFGLIKENVCEGKRVMFGTLP